MAWSADWPLTGGSDINKYEAIAQLWRGVSERNMAANDDYWPRHNVSWSSKTIDSVTTDSSGNYVLSQTEYGWDIVGGCSGISRFVDYDCGTGFEYIPSFYDVYVEVNGILGEKKVIDFQIASNTSGTLTVSELEMANWITSKVISAASELDEKKMHIIKRNGLWWNDRWPNWANDNEIYKGTLTFSGSGYIVDSSQSWTDDELNTKELMIYNTGGRLKRLTISDTVSGTHLLFSPIGDTLTGEFSVVEPNTICIPGRTPGALHLWYGGTTEAWWTHNPEDIWTDNIGSPGTIGTTNMPSSQESWNTFNGSICEQANYSSFDVDLWSEFDEICSEADDSKAPNFTKTVRALQKACEDLSFSFVEEKSYDGAIVIPTITPAEMFKLATVNYINTFTTTSDSSGNFAFTVTGLPPGSHTVYYTTRLSDQPIDNLLEFGTSSISNGDSITYFSALYPSRDGNCCVALGWTRKYPKEFRYMYDRTVFIPGVEADLDIADPPSDEAPGIWTTRVKSSGYKEHSSMGFINDTGSGFINGDKARFSGDNGNDPGLNPNDLVDAANPPFSYSYDTPYNDFFYEGRFDTSIESDISNAKQGILTSGTVNFIYDNLQDWWNAPFGYGTLRTETGTSTGGSSGTLIDTTKSGNPFWQTSTGRWNNFILEILDGSHAGKLVPIIETNNPSSGTLTFDSSYGIVASGGISYRIREPAYINNIWASGILTVTRYTDGYSESRRIVQNNDKYLFVTPSFSFIPSGGDTYNINKRETGGTWEWSSSGNEWIRPNPTNIYQPGILPDTITKYGRIMKGDYVWANTLNEIYECLNVLNWTKETLTWTSREDGVTPETNATICGSGPGGVSCETLIAGDQCEDLRTILAICFGIDCHIPSGSCGGFGTGGVESDGTPPFALYEVSVECDLYGGGGGFAFNEALAGKQYSYGVVEPPYIWFNKNVDMYSYAIIRESDPNEGSTGPDCSTGSGYVSYIFNDNGVDVLFRQYKKFYTSGSTNQSRVVSSALGGDISVSPDQTACPPIIYDCDPSGTGHPQYQINLGYEGYIVYEECAIAKWNTTNGFTYVDHAA